MSGDSQDDGASGWYTRNFGQPRFAEEAYGYWVAASGAVLVLVGVFVFLSGTTAGKGTPLFWTARQASAVFVGAGVPLLVLGFVYRLPVSENVYRLAVAGVVVCLFALVAFLVFYPDRWNVSPGSPAPDRSSQVTAVYAVGLIFSVFSATVLPAVTPKRDEVVKETVETDSRFEVYRDVSADWRWKLRDSEGNTVADSDVGYPTEREAEASVEGFRDEVAGASVETRDVLEEYLLSNEGTVEEGERGQQAIGTHEAVDEKGEVEKESGDETETSEEAGARYELHDEAGVWVWRLLGDDGETVAVSGEEHASRSEAVESIEEFRRSVLGAELVGADPACVVYRDDSGNWRWRLVHGGETVAVSPEGYVERDGVETVLKRLKETEGTETEVYETPDGWCWRFVHTNGEVLAESGTVYKERADAGVAAETARELLGDAETTEVDDAYFVLYTEEDGLRWTLFGVNGRAVAVSAETHGTREETLDALEGVRTRAPEAPLVG
jgi:uncharacterized protein YegP (UPF0339 family)